MRLDITRLINIVSGVLQAVIGLNHLKPFPYHADGNIAQVVIRYNNENKNEVKIIKTEDLRL